MLAWQLLFELNGHLTSVPKTTTSQLLKAVLCCKNKLNPTFYEKQRILVLHTHTLWVYSSLTGLCKCLQPMEIQQFVNMMDSKPFGKFERK